MKDWNPTEYLRFEAERTRPARDLASRIDLAEPGNVIDIGCGPGNSTLVLSERWPSSAILGIDSSPAMIEKARKDYPDGNWTVADASAFEARGSYDVVFSNATIQWIPDHGKLVPRLFDALRPGGALAVQIPAFTKMPVHEAIRAVAESDGWRAATKGCADGFTFRDLGYYYDLLCPCASRIDAWETLYSHVLPSRLAIVDFVRSTGLRPYLDALRDDAEREDFLADLAVEVGKAYPERADGKVLFPFDRLFFIAYK
jgi:trans-aconitate 2-methyltransferase